MKTKVEFRNRRGTLLCTKMMAHVPGFEEEIEIGSHGGGTDRLRVVAVQWKVITNSEDDPIVEIFIG